MPEDPYRESVDDDPLGEGMDHNEPMEVSDQGSEPMGAQKNKNGWYCQVASPQWVSWIALQRHHTFLDVLIFRKNPVMH